MAMMESNEFKLTYVYTQSKWNMFTAKLIKRYWKMFVDKSYSDFKFTNRNYL